MFSDANNRNSWTLEATLQKLGWQCQHGKVPSSCELWATGDLSCSHRLSGIAFFFCHRFMSCTCLHYIHVDWKFTTLSIQDRSCSWFARYWFKPSQEHHRCLQQWNGKWKHIDFNLDSAISGFELEPVCPAQDLQNHVSSPSYCITGSQKWSPIRSVLGVSFFKYHFFMHDMDWQSRIGGLAGGGHWHFGMHTKASLELPGRMPCRRKVRKKSERGLQLLVVQDLQDCSQLGICR